MRTLFIILGSVAAVISFLLSFFMGGIAYIPIVSGAIFGVIALIISKKNVQRETVPKLIIALCFLAGVITSVNLLKEDKVAQDNIIELKEEKSKEDAQKELEGLDIEE